MSVKNLLKLIIAVAVALPSMISVTSTAQAQKIMSRQKIVNGLQHRGQKKQRRATRRTNQGQAQRTNRRKPQRTATRRAPQQQFRAPPPIAKRRAPPTQKFRAPPQVAKRRAPPRANAPQQFRAPPQVAKRRAPPRANAPQQFRAPPQVAKRRAPPTQQFRAPPQVAKRRAPPRANGNPQQFRAPPRVVNRGRAPNRNPQHFNSQVAVVGERAIRIEQRAAAQQRLNTDQRLPAQQLEQQAFANTGTSSVDLEILFDYDSARISPESIRQLIILGEALQDVSLSGSRIMIAGHTDAAGGNAYNNNLSYQRAQSVSNFLIDYAGIRSDRLAIEGYGEDYLKYPDAPNSGQNRRVEIINLGG